MKKIAMLAQLWLSSLEYCLVHNIRYLQTIMSGRVWAIAPVNQGYAFRNAREMANVLVGAGQRMGVMFQGVIDSKGLSEIREWFVLCLGADQLSITLNNSKGSLLLWIWTQHSEF